MVSSTPKTSTPKERKEDSLANLLFSKKPAVPRVHRPLEAFQKLFAERINDALRDSGYFAMNEEQVSKDMDNWVDESNEEQMARVKEMQRERMRVRMRVVKQLFEDASPGDLEAIDEMIGEEKKEEEERRKSKKKLQADDGGNEWGPDDFQR